MKRQYKHFKKPDRISNPASISSVVDEAIYHALRPLDLVAVKMENRWGVAPLLIESIRADGGTQPRDHINEDVVTRYAEDIAAGHIFPPVTVFHDGEAYWLADGFHRLVAHESLNAEHIDAEIVQGTRRDAVLYSVGANATHGYPRTNADKRRVVLALLNDAEWAKWSDREIARRCVVDGKVVARLRPNVSAAEPQIERTVQRNGTVYQQNIGRASEPTVDQDMVTFDPATGKFDDPWKGERRNENERRKHLSVHIIDTFKYFQELDVTPERAANEFFVSIAYTVEPLLGSASWLSEFAEHWRKKCKAL